MKTTYSANQIYRMSGSVKPFNRWIDENKTIYNKRQRKVSFEQWLNRQMQLRNTFRYRGAAGAGSMAGLSPEMRAEAAHKIAEAVAQKDATAQKGKPFWDKFKQGVTKAGEIAQDFSDIVAKDKDVQAQIKKEQTPPAEAAKKKFLGLPNGVVIIGGIILVSLVTFGIYKIIKAQK